MTNEEDQAKAPNVRLVLSAVSQSGRGTILNKRRFSPPVTGTPTAKSDVPTVSRTTTSEWKRIQSEYERFDASTETHLRELFKQGVQ